VIAVQALLNQLGYDAGPPTGQVSPQTTSAIIAYQSVSGLIPDGQPTADLRDSLVAAMRAR
jgi:peptidoglycan hydrolase-like protein with peptidoglycan-binding domain